MQRVDMNCRWKEFISVRHCTLDDVSKIYNEAFYAEKLLEMESSAGRNSLIRTLPGFVIGEIFWQESSRTYHSFAAAGARLGASVFCERGVKKTKWKDGKKVIRWELVFSSEAKDAYLEDEVRAWASFYDLLIFRTPEEGMVQRMVNILREFGYDTPVINAGDGKGEHPTQTLLDGFCLFKKLGLDIEKDWKKLSEYPVAMVNDCKNSRTIHSLAWFLGVVFKMPLLFISPPGLEMPRHILCELEAAGVRYSEHNSLQQAPIYYVTRLQKEYFKNEAEFQKCRKYFSITREVADKFRVEIVMHPFPRSKQGNELPIWLPSDPRTHEVSLDKDPRAAYFHQMRCGIPLRMALIKELLNPYVDFRDLWTRELLKQRLRRSFMFMPNI